MQNAVIQKILTYTSRKDFLSPLFLALLFLFCSIFFNYIYFCILISLLLALFNYYSLSSQFTENMLFLCSPLIGLIANYQSLCLVNNAMVFMLWTRAYACHGRIKLRYYILFLFIIISFGWYRESSFMVYTGALMPGIIGPINIWLYSLKNKFVNKSVFVIPLWMLLSNISKGYYFVAYWDIEIIAYYAGWFLGLNKENVVKKIFTLSLLIIVYSYFVLDVCEKTGL